MSLRFQLGPFRDGRLRIRRVPYYSMPHWRVTEATANRVCYRPTWGTAGYALGYSLPAAVALAALLWMGGTPWTSSPRTAPALPTVDEEREIVERDAELAAIVGEMEQRLSPEASAELAARQARREARQAEFRDRQSSWSPIVSTAGRLFYGLALCTLGAVAILPLALLPWQQIELEITADGQFMVRPRGLWSRTFRSSSMSFDEIDYDLEAETMRHHRQWIPIGWRWLVKLRPGLRPELVPANDDIYEVMFFIGHQYGRPEEGATPPDGVRTLAGHLTRLLGAANMVENRSH